MLGDLPSPNNQDTEVSPDVADDRLDARWFNRGTASNGAVVGIPMPTSKDADLYNMNHRRRGRAFIFNHMNFDPKLGLNTSKDADLYNMNH